MPTFALNLRKGSSITKPSSSFEHSFILKNTFKRNQRYLNLSKINKEQQQQQMSRRKPLKSTQNISVDQKINNSFMNTTAALSDKVQHNINTFKIRMSAGGNEFHEQEDYPHYLAKYDEETKKSRISRSNSSRQSRHTNIQEKVAKSALNLSDQQILKIQHKKIRGMALDKYCSREQYYQSRNKRNNDERLFNNYTLQKPDLSHIQDFQNYLQRDLDFKLNNVHLNLEYNTQKLYQDYYYKKTSMQCNTNYKTEKRTPRKFYNQKRKQDQSATDLSPQKVKRSFQKVTMLRSKTIDGFYANSGRELPCQLDQRNNNPLTNHWVNENNKIKRKPKEYHLRKMKEDLVQKKLQETKQRKKPKFQRNQICDSMYFRIQKA